MRHLKFTVVGLLLLTTIHSEGSDWSRTKTRYDPQSRPDTSQLVSVDVEPPPAPPVEEPTPTLPNEEPSPAPLPPLAVITGPETGRPGDIVVLHASESKNATGYVWRVETDATVPEEEDPQRQMEWANNLRAANWTVIEPENPKKPLWMISPNRTQVLLASYPGTYTAILSVGNKETDTPSIAVHKFRSISGDAPSPPLDDPPDDPSPPGVSLEDQAAKWASQVTDHRGRLPDLAISLMALGSSHFLFDSIQDIDDQLQGIIEDSFASEAPKWRTLFLQLDAALNVIRGESSVEQYGKAVADIGRGIEKGAK